MSTAPAEQTSLQGAGSQNIGKPGSREVCSYCMECYHYCPVKARVENGVIVRIRGTQTPYTEGRLCLKGMAAPMRVYDHDRVKVPLRRTNPEKGLGIDPGWQEITWDEALDTIAQRIGGLREHNPKGLKIISREHPRAGIAKCWARAFGTPNVGNSAGAGGGINCGNAAHTLGTEIWDSMHDQADYEYTRYALYIGSNNGFESDRGLPTDAPRLADARLRGMKLVVVDPRFTTAAAKADEWVPIRPSTDGALILGMVNLLLNEHGIYDAPFLQLHTNAPYLIGPDGYYVRDPETGEPLIWDTAEERAKPFHAFNDPVASRQAALEGQYTINGVPCQPAFQILKDRVREYTPQRVEEITTVPAATVRRVAQEFGEHAQIGSSIQIEGQQWPVRGSVVVFYRGIQAHVHSTLTTMALYTLHMIVGAMGVPGGILPSLGTGLQLGAPPLPPRPDGVVAFDLHRPTYPPTWPPTEYNLGNYLPFDVVGAAHLNAVTGSQPEKWGLNPQMILFYENSNPLMVMGDLPKLEAYHRNAFVIVMDQYLTETAELADIVLPSTFQLERHSVAPVKAGPNHVGFLYSLPAIPAQHEARDWMEVLIELAERVGCLYGEGGFNHQVNTAFHLSTKYSLELHRRYASAQIQEKLTKSIIGEEGWQKLVADGVYIREVPATEKYMRYGIARLPFYNEALKTIGDRLIQGLKETGAYDRLAGELDFSDYDALPKWKPSPIHQPSDKYDLYAVNGKSILFSHTRSAFNPWLMELAEKDPYALKIWINPATAVNKRIKDGERIWVESPVGKVQGEAMLTEGIHPECLGITGCLGHWCSHPISGSKGVHFNTLVELSLRHTDPITSTLQGAAVRVRVYPYSSSP